VQLRQYNLFQQLFPYTDACLDEPIALALIKQVLYDTDQRKIDNKPVAPAFLLAALLWPSLSRLLPDKPIKNFNQQEVLLEAAKLMLLKQQERVAIPRRIAVLMQEIWLLQLRLTRPRRAKKKSLSLLEHPRFRAGYDFLILRAKAGEEEVANDVDWWTNFLNSNDSSRENLLSHHHASNKKRKRRRKPKNVQTEALDLEIG